MQTRVGRGTVAATLASLVISLFARRRRMWVTIYPAEGTGTLVEVAALAKNEGADLTADGTGLAEHRGVTPPVSRRSAT